MKQEKATVLILAKVSSQLLTGLEQRFRVYALPQQKARGFLKDRSDQIRAIVSTGDVGVANEIIDALPLLEIIAIHGIGMDKVDLQYARGRNIVITNTPDVQTDDVADMAIALILATARRLAANDRFVRTGYWTSKPLPPFGRKISNSRIGIVGLGRIGVAIAKRLRAFTPNIAYSNLHPVADCGLQYFGKVVDLARQSDLLVVATSGGQPSYHVVDAAVIDALGPRGIIVNVGRGSAVDEKALVAALSSGRLGGAGLDVFEDEPNVPPALLDMDNVILSPHQASATSETRERMAELVLKNLVLHFSGRGAPSRVV